MQILVGVEDEEEKALREYRQRMAALLPTAGGSNFNAIFGGQKDLDADFDAFMEEEYEDDKIGDGGEDAEVED